MIPRLLRLLGYGLAALLVNALAAPAEADGLRLLALGDSLTAGYGLPGEDAFPAQLEAALRARGLDVTVVNGGVSGDTSAGGLARIDWLLSEPFDAVIVELGANDGLRGLDPKMTEANLDRLLAELKMAGVRVLLCGMKAPPNLGADYGRAFDSLYPRLAAKFGVAFYPFFLDGVAAVAHLNQDDGIHPNAEGVAVVVDRLLPHVLTVLAPK